MLPSIYQPANYASLPFVLQFLPVDFTNTTATFSVGSARATTTDWVMDYPGTIQNLPGQIVIDTSVIGVNGCSPVGLEAVTPANGIRLLPVYAIDRTSGTTNGSLNGQVAPALIIATRATDFVPEGYDAFKQVGFVLLSTTGDLVPYAMTGLYNERYIQLQDALEFLTDGAETDQTTAPIILSLGSGGPNLKAAGVSEVELRYDFTPNAAGDIAQIVATGLTPVSEFPIQIKASAAVEVIGNVRSVSGSTLVRIDGVLTSVAAIDYALTSASASLSLSLSGFTYTIPFQG